MKKIIYSLVIMIAAGSLFTSCIEQVEPLGIQDLRFAKAEYIRALKDLRAADAEYRRAEAAVQQAIARYEDALTAGVNADTEYQKLLNEYQALVNQDYAGEVAYNEAERLAKIDSLEKAMEVRELNHKRALAEAEKEMRLAQEDLRVTIRNINLAAGDLTASEKVAIYEAAAVYYWLTEQSILIKNDIAQVQMTIDSLKKNKEIYANKKWDTTSFAYLDADKYYEAKIAEEYAKIDMLMDLYENMPDTSAALADWKAFIDSYDDAINSVKLDSTKMEAGMEVEKALMKESIRDFDVAVAEWIEENWVTEDEGKTYVQPAISAGDKPTEAEYTSTNAPSLKVVMEKKEGVETATWEKFNYLLKSYAAIDSFNFKDAKQRIFAPGDKDTVIFRQDMKDFILGKEGNKAGSQEYNYTENKVKKTLNADYGLLGAYDILNRDLVTAETEAATEKQIADAKKAMENAEKKWDADQKILVDGFSEADFAPYGDAIKNLKDQIKVNGEGADAMVAAIKDLKAAIVSTGTNFENFDGNDSTKLFEAILAFAEARANYLDFPASKKPKKIDPQDPTKRDLSVFYYSKGKSGGSKAILAQAAFTALTESAMNAGEYNYITKEPGDLWCPDVADKKDSVVNAFANIVRQLDTTTSGKGLYDMFNWTKDTIEMPAVSNQLQGALYGLYKIDSWADPKEVQNLDGTKYKPSDLIKKENAVYDSVANYIKAYKDFWGQVYTAPNILSSADSAAVKAYINALEGGDATTIATAKKAVVTQITTAYPTNTTYNPTRYSKATFKAYEDGSPVVTFTGASVDGTRALSAILTSVDTVNTPQDFYEKNPVNGNSLIFGKDVTGTSKVTDFYNYEYAVYNYWKLTTTKASEQLKKIRAEIKKVEDKFAEDEAQAGKLDEKKYKAAVAKWEKENAAAEAYLAAKLLFTGIYDYDDDDNPIPNDVYALVNADKKAGRDTAVQGKTAKLKGNDITVLFAKNLVGQYVGWSDVLGGEQLELAIELFGEEPWEMFNEYQMHKDQYAAQIAELEVLKKNAQAVFTAKAKYEGYTGEGTSAGSEEDVKKLYEHYKAAYEAALKAIVEYDEFGNIPLNGAGKVNKCLKKINGLEKDLAEIEDKGINWDRKITEAENELEVLKNRQKTGDQALKMAKENYDRLREYLLSQDGVSYVIPVSTADVDDVLMNLDYILRTLGHTVADVYAEVADKIGA